MISTTNHATLLWSSELLSTIHYLSLSIVIVNVCLTCICNPWATILLSVSSSHWCIVLQPQQSSFGPHPSLINSCHLLWSWAFQFMSSSIHYIWFGHLWPMVNFFLQELSFQTCDIFKLSSWIWEGIFEYIRMLL